MKYLKKYNEAIAYVGTSPMKSDIQDILLELKDEGFEAFVQIGVEGKNEWCKVEIAKENKFDYSQIEETVERIKDYMTDNNFYIYEYTSFLRGDENIPDIKVDLRRKFNRFGNGRWSERAYFFEIKFKNIPNATNEELRSDVYKSAADKLTKMGHKKRPEELMKWHEITKQREIDAKKLEVLNDCKQMGVYQLYLGYRKDGKTYDYKGDFYINLTFDNYNLYDQYVEWKDGENSLWIGFSFGVIPVNEDGKKFCKEVTEPIIGLGSDKLTYWLGSFWLNISRTISPGEPLRFQPEDKGYFEEHEGQWYLSNRSSAIQFRNTLYKIFSGDIIIRETGDKPGGMKEDIIEELCNVREHDIDEYEDIMNSIKRMNINKLYKD